MPYIHDPWRLLSTVQNVLKKNTLLFTRSFDSFFIYQSIPKLNKLLSYLVKHLNEFQDMQIMVLPRDR